jgi:hypothetical protein
MNLLDWFMEQRGWVRIVLTLPVGFAVFFGMCAAANWLENKIRSLTDRQERSVRRFKKICGRLDVWPR